MESKNNGPDTDLLDELSAAEDDFDVDLLACGCRLRSGGRITKAEVEGMEPVSGDLSIYDVLRLYNFDEDGLAGFVGGLIDEGKLDPAKVFDLADRAASGNLRDVK